MRAITLAQVLLRLLGVFFFVSALSAVGSVLLLLPAFSDPLSRMTRVIAILNVVVTGIAGIALIRHGDSIGQWLVSDLGDHPGPAAGSEQIQSIAFAVAGVYFLVAGLRSGARIAALFITRPPEDQVAALISDEGAAIAAAIVEIGAGVILLLGRRGVASAWNAMRGRDVEEKTQT